MGAKAIEGLGADLLARVAPVSLALEQVLPVLTALEPLLPGAGLQRGTVTGLSGPGASSLAAGLVAGPSVAGSWTAVVGLPTFGLVAAADAGVVLDRLALVAPPDPSEWADVVGALIGAFDVVLIRPAHRVTLTTARRLTARARERGSVLLHVRAGGAPPWPEEPACTLEVVRARWYGLGDGHGRLESRRVRIRASGRRQASRHHHVDLWLPGPDGRITRHTPEGTSSESGSRGRDGKREVTPETVVLAGRVSTSSVSSTVPVPVAPVTVGR